MLPRCRQMQAHELTYLVDHCEFVVYQLELGYWS